MGIYCGGAIRATLEFTGLGVERMSFADRRLRVTAAYSGPLAGRRETLLTMGWLCDDGSVSDGRRTKVLVVIPGVPTKVIVAFVAVLLRITATQIGTRSCGDEMPSLCFDSIA